MTGCVILPVPLPGIKSGRDVDESTAREITVGTPMVDVLLRMGEPDSVSADGRKFAYRFSRTWGAVLWAVGGTAMAAGDITPVQYGEAVVIEFDDTSHVSRAERRAGNWMEARPDDEPIFYQSDYVHTMVLGGEPVIVQRRVRWWTGRRTDEDDPDRVVLGLPPWTANAFSGNDFTTQGNLFLTASTFWLRPAFATGTAPKDFIRIPKDSIRGIVPFERATVNEQTLVVLHDRRCLAVQPIPASIETGDRSLTDWLTDACARGDRTSAIDTDQEGWVVWVSTKVDKGMPRPPIRFSCLWLTPTGLRFEHYEINGAAAGSEFLDWAAIERIDPGSRNRTIIGVKISSADVVCRDGRTLCIAQAKPTPDTTYLATQLRSAMERGLRAP